MESHNKNLEPLENKAEKPAHSSFLSSFTTNKSNKKKIIATIFGILFLTASIGAGVYLNNSAKKTETNAANPSIILTSNNAAPRIGTNFVVAVTMNTQGVGVTGTDLRIRYDATKLTFVSMQKGTFLPQEWIAGSAANGIASMVLGCRIDANQSYPANGTGLIATITFTARVAGATTISVDPTTKVSVSGGTTNMLGATTPVTVNIGTGATPVPTPTGANITPIGNLDSATCTTVTGWACDANNFNTGVQINFYDGQAGAGGVIIGTTNASTPREAAVASRCGNTANHGFIWNLPNIVKDGRNHSIYAYALNIPTGVNPLLTGSPKVVNCAVPTTPSPGPTRSPSPVPTRSPSPRPVTPSPRPATPSPRPTATPTRSPSPRPTATRTPSPRPTATPTRSPSPRPGATSSPSPTANSNPPQCLLTTIDPGSGPAPFTVSLHGSGSAGNGVGIDGYRWDFENDGTWDSGVTIDPISHTYTTPGTYNPVYQVHNVNNLWSSTCGYGFPIVVTENSTPVPTATPSPAPQIAGDVNGDGFVTIVDIGIIIDNYDLQPLPDPRADLDGDGIANIVDIGIVVDNYGL
jgi:hypothetical protein